jgi:hypothetical protein
VQPGWEWKNGNCYILWVCVWSLRYETCNAHAPTVIVCPAVQYFSHLVSHKPTIYIKKELVKIKRVFSFSLQLLLGTFLVLSRPDQTRCQMNVGLHVKYHYSCQLIMKLKFSPQVFERYSNMKFNENPSSGSPVVPCRRMDGQTW